MHRLCGASSIACSASSGDLPIKAASGYRDGAVRSRIGAFGDEPPQNVARRRSAPRIQLPPMKALVLGLLIVAMPLSARAAEIDPATVQLWDVVYTSDGSLVTGVAVETSPRSGL